MRVSGAGGAGVRLWRGEGGGRERGGRRRAILLGRELGAVAEDVALEGVGLWGGEWGRAGRGGTDRGHGGTKARERQTDAKQR